LQKNDLFLYYNYENDEKNRFGCSPFKSLLLLGNVGGVDRGVTELEDGEGGHVDASAAAVRLRHLAEQIGIKECNVDASTTAERLCHLADELCIKRGHADPTPAPPPNELGIKRSHVDACTTAVHFRHHEDKLGVL
jgi:hypothetical protein